MGSRDVDEAQTEVVHASQEFQRVFHVKSWCNAIIKAQASVCMSPSVTSIVSEQAVLWRGRFREK